MANLFNPNGEFVSVPDEQVSDALNQGFKQPTPEQESSYFKTQVNAPAPSSAQASPQMPSADNASNMVNMVDPRGDLQGVPAEQVQAALDQGFTHPTPEKVSEHFNEEKFGTPGQMALTALEHAASVQTLGGSAGVENALSKAGVPGVSPEERQARAETNPWSGFAGDLGSLLIGGPVPKLMGLAGEGMAGFLGLGRAGAGVISRIGATGTKLGIENMIFQGGNEVNNLFTSKAQPEEIVGPLVARMGLSGLIGFGLGATGKGVGELWNATGRPQLQNMLERLAAKYSGNAMEEAGISPGISGGPDVPPPLPPEITGIPTGAGAIPNEVPIKGQGTIKLENVGPGYEKGSQELYDEMMAKPVSDPVINEAIATSGMEVDPLMKEGMGPDPYQRNNFQVLMQAPSRIGTRARAIMDKFFLDAKRNILGILGKTPEEAEALSVLSPNEVGHSVTKSLIDELREKFQPISDKYDEWFRRAGKVPITNVVRGQLEDNLTLLGLETGAIKQPSSSMAKLLNEVTEELPLQQTLEDLSKYRAGIMGKVRANPAELGYIGSGLNKIFNQAEDNLITHAYSSGMVAGDLAKFRAIQAEYGPVRQLLTSLAERVPVKSYKGVETFIQAIKGLKPEKVLEGLTQRNDADLIQKILPSFPETMGKVRDYHLNDLFREITAKAPKGELFNVNNLIKKIKDMTPEERNFIFSPGTLDKIMATNKLITSVPRNMNPSGSATTFMQLLKKHGPVSVMSFAASMGLGQGFFISSLIGAMAEAIKTEGPDAIRLGILKFLGSSEPVEAGAFKSMVDMMNNVMKGESLINTTIKNFFKAGSKTPLLPEQVIPDEKKKEKLDKILLNYQENPDKMMNMSDAGSSYLPEHNGAIGDLTARAVTYLNSLRPKETKNSPLDEESEPNAIEKAQFDRALEIAEQPLIILDDIKDGTLTTDDMTHMMHIYPALQKRLTQKLTDEMINHTSKEESIPYKTKMALSLFMGQTLDSTFSPASIQSIQSIYQNKGTGPMENGNKHHKPPMKSLDKLVQQEATPNQTRQMNRRA